MHSWTPNAHVMKHVVMLIRPSMVVTKLVELLPTPMASPLLLLKNDPPNVVVLKVKAAVVSLLEKMASTRLHLSQFHAVHLHRQITIQNDPGNTKSVVLGPQLPSLMTVTIRSQSNNRITVVRPTAR